MRKQLRTIRARPIALATLLIAMLAGCADTQAWLSRHFGGSSSKASRLYVAPETDDYLDELYRLADGDPATQAEIFADVAAAADLMPGPSTNLRFALVLATPMHAEADPERAQSLLRELLAQTPLLTPAEVSLATIHLKAVEERIVLNAAARQLRETEQAAVDRRVDTVEAENRRLRDELKDAEDKLEAITSIERSIREQEQ
jgi:hypothetical protein